MTNLDELERLAKAAEGATTCVTHFWESFRREANPAVILELVAEVRAVREDKARIATLFAAIKHGDEAHRIWLKEAIEAHFAGLPVPTPIMSAAEKEQP
jgi:hypothetical protein